MQPPNQLSGLDEGRGSRRKDAKGDEEHLAVTSHGSLRHTRWQLQPLPVRRTQLLTVVAATTVAYRWIECKGGPGGISCVFTNGKENGWKTSAGAARYAFSFRAARPVAGASMVGAANT
jgi:hypothetical protein